MADIYLQKLKRVKAFVFDIDGVLTDGNVYVSDDGHYTRSSNIKDGYALNKAAQKGYPIIFISGGNAVGMQHRLEALGVTEVHLNVKDKRTHLEHLLNKYNLEMTECIMMGDDEPDLDLMAHVGCSACPSDAVQRVKSAVDFVSAFRGGRGCIREVIESRLKLDGAWD